MFGNNQYGSAIIDFGIQPEGNRSSSFLSSLTANDNKNNQQHWDWEANNNNNSGRPAFGLNQQRCQQRMVMNNEEEEKDDAMTTRYGVGSSSRMPVANVQQQPEAMKPSERANMWEEEEDEEEDQELGEQHDGVVAQQQPAHQQQQEMRMDKPVFFRHHHSAAGGHAAGLAIRLPSWGNAEEKRKQLGLFNACSHPTYNSSNALKALQRFVQRGQVDQHSFQVFRTVDTPPGQIGHQSAKTLHYRAVLLVSVQALGWYEKTFTAVSSVPGLARRECALQLCLKLLEFGLITEFGIELCCPNKKALLDPTRLLDRTMKAWLDADNESFLAKMDEIEENPKNFEDFVDESEPNGAQQQVKEEEVKEEKNQQQISPSPIISSNRRNQPLIQVQEKAPRRQLVQVQVVGGPQVGEVHHQSSRQNIDKNGGTLIVMNVGENSGGGLCESGAAGQEGWRQRKQSNAAADANGKKWTTGEEKRKNPTATTEKQQSQKQLGQMMEEQLDKFQEHKQWDAFFNRWAGDAKTGGCSSSKMAPPHVDSVQHLQEDQKKADEVSDHHLLHF